MSKIWFGKTTEDFYQGFDDDFLVEMVSERTRSADTRLGYKSVPVLFWPSEIYSFGRCFREWLNWPSCLPLPFYSDHGVCFTGHLAPHEVSNRSKYHLTWDSDRYESIRNQEHKIVLRVPHPWITYRRSMGYFKKPDAKGTLIFYSHSIIGIDEFDYDLEKYVSELKLLSNEYFPLVFCMHMHDVNKGVHHRLRKYNFPVVTIGNTGSQYFVDRFYELVSSFKYATSNSGGSEAYYCSEIGLSYFLMGEAPKYFNYSHSQNPKGIQKPRDEVEGASIEKKNTWYRVFPPRDISDLHGYVEKVLGLEVNSDSAKGKVRSFLVLELLRLLPVYLAKNIKSAVNRVSNTCE